MNPTTKATEYAQPHPPKDPLGRVYTPPSFALAVVNAIQRGPLETPRVVMDPSAGRGTLLWAMAERWPDAARIGLDIDPEAGPYFAPYATSWDVADWLTVFRFWDRLRFRELCPDGGPDLILMNPPFGKAVPTKVTRHHIVAACALSPHVMVILPLPYVGMDTASSELWEKRRPAILHRVRHRVWPDRLREVCCLEYREDHHGPTIVRDLEWSGLTDEERGR